ISEAEGRGSSGTFGTSFVCQIHLTLVLCVWYIWHSYGASGTSV
ncbi:hypothetical protein KSS87_015690, partial [Heliosperma pusillum]